MDRWCFFEGCASGLVKGEYCLWNEESFEGATELDGVRRQCKAGRLPPMSPSQFETTLRTRLRQGSLGFTNGKVDADLVIDLYRSGFIQAFETLPQLSLGHNVISFAGLGFSTIPNGIDTFVSALSFVQEHCSFEKHGPIQISVEGNGFSNADRQRLWDTVRNCKGIVLHV